MKNEIVERPITYTPKILRNMAEICEAFGVGEKMVKAWVKQGAPIAVEGDGRRVRYSAEMVMLQKWRVTEGNPTPFGNEE
ncbi:MAG: MerR family transcriptional regulator [Desulfovibrio sp.]|nr:MerR family transcriptional regulator [Desulfovibrio sp.]